MHVFLSFPRFFHFTLFFFPIFGFKYYISFSVFVFPIFLFQKFYLPHLCHDNRATARRRRLQHHDVLCLAAGLGSGAATTGGFGRRRRSAYVFDSSYMEVLIYLFLIPCSIYFVTGYYRWAYENIQELQQINYHASISSNRCWASSMYTLPVIGVLSGRHAVPLAHGWLALDDVRMVYSMYTISSFFSSKKKE